MATATNPFAGIGRSYENTFGNLTYDQLGQMAGDPSRGGELAAMLMQSQYGGKTTGAFGDYLRNQADTINLINQYMRPYGYAGNYAGDPYRGFEDIYESLGAGKGSPLPGQRSIGDWRNMMYQNLLGGGSAAVNEKVRLDEPGSLADAQSYTGRMLAPLLGSTMTQTDLRILQNLLPQLFTKYNQQYAGQAGAPLWAQWLAQNGYLPNQAR